MSLSIDEDEDRSINYWWNQNSDVTGKQKQKSQNGVVTGKEETAIKSNAVASQSRGQTLKVAEKKDHSTERKGRWSNDRVVRNRSRSSQEQSHRNDISMRTAKFLTEYHDASTHCQCNNLSCPSEQFKHPVYRN